jgi:hypothetical protein
MRSSWRSVGGLVVICAAAIGVACGGAREDGGGNIPDAGSGSGGPADSGTPDSGAPDAGPPDAGPPDAGPPDAGADAGAAITPPDLGPDWKFQATAEGLPLKNVMGVSADESGNLFVAGGTAGLFVQRGGQGPFKQYGIADGLHPYGYLNGETAKVLNRPDGSDADPAPSLAATPVISVSGGKGGTVFVGYRGKPNCEDAWHGDQWTVPAQWGDPSVYKSGDADKVTLTADGLSVVHYDIFSGPGVVGDEPVGREKLCSIYRVVYQHDTNYVWFGGNHGFALGKADFAGNPTCNGQLGCAGVLEHVHPAFNDSMGNLVTGDYWGIAVDPFSQGGFHDVWFGGMARTTRFRFGETGGDFWSAQPKTETYVGGNINAPGNAVAKAAYQNRVDVWPDGVEEYDSAGNPTYPTPAQWRAGLDVVSGIATDPADGSVYIASFAHGIRHLSRDGSFIEDLTVSSKKLFGDTVGAIAIDTDGSLWVGYNYEGGISRIHKGGAVEHYANVLGALEKSPVFDIQITPGTPRKVLVAFQNGAVGVYQGK